MVNVICFDVVQDPPVVQRPVETPSDSDLSLSLQRRLQELREESRGRRFLVCTQLGFLNVHSEPGDPYDSRNIVGRLYEGEIVTGLEQVGDWLHHDRGGWSIRFHGGFEWLRPIDGDASGAP